MLDIVKREIQHQLDEWGKTVNVLASYGASAQAETLSQAHRDLARTMTVIESRVTRLSIQQYATQHGVQPDTVRRWVRAGQLPAAKGADGSWSIPYGAVRRKLKRVA